MLRLLFLGDVVGRPGRRAVTAYLRAVRRGPIDERPAFVIANAENASGGKGLDPATAEELQDAGVDVLTSGNHVWQNREIVPYIKETSRVLRPANFAPDVPGRGSTICAVRSGSVAVGVVNLIGRVFMGPAECPFRRADLEIERLRTECRVIVVDMHGEATSEKVAMGRYLDGRASLVIGTHTHVLTADEGILPGGTAYMTDAGMCGPEDSVLGVRTDRVIERFLTQMPNRFDVATGPTLVQGALVDVDPETGKALRMVRVRERAES
jgi:metallophosphoesterase (TIGR00282 family)